MADVKWIKITTDIFDDEKILLIESLPDANAIIVVWFKLLCLAGKQNNSGVFVMNNRIPYTEKMLATIFRMNELTVELALKTFENFGMIEIVDGVITIPNWGKHQSLERIEARREYQKEYQREYRKKQKLLASNEDEHKCLHKDLCKSNINSLEEERDKEEEVDKELDNNIGAFSPEKTPARKKFIKPTLQEVADYCNERGNNVDAHKWYNHYESNGWMVGKNKMKDWKASVRTWERNSYDKPQTKPQSEHGASRLMQMIKDGVFDE